MSVIENTIPKTIPVTTVFMEGSLAGQSQKHVKRVFEFISRGVGIVKRLFELSGDIWAHGPRLKQSRHEA